MEGRSNAGSSLAEMQSAQQERVFVERVSDIRSRLTKDHKVKPPPLHPPNILFHSYFIDNCQQKDYDYIEKYHYFDLEVIYVFTISGSASFFCLSSL